MSPQDTRKAAMDSPAQMNRRAFLATAGTAAAVSQTNLLRLTSSLFASELFIYGDLELPFKAYCQLAGIKVVHI